MSLFKNVFRIESTRLKHYDYSQPGEYFVTICIQNHECLFGNVHEEEMRLSTIGEIARKCWKGIPCHFNNIELDEYVIMPNHLHGIVIINDHGRDVACNVSTRTNTCNVSTRTNTCNVSTRTNTCNVSTGISPKRGSLGVIIRSYKSAVSNWCHANRYNDFCWQPRFYEHIIRNEKELNDIRDYIINNPLKWYFDEENPENRWKKF